MLKKLMNKKVFLFIPLVIILGSSPITVLAASGFGAVANNLMTPISIVSNFMYSASLVLGSTSLFAAFLKYLQFRVNPLANPIGRVVVLLIIGVLFICLPLIHKLTSSGIPFML